MNESLFTKEYSVYWPPQYADVVKYLLKKPEEKDEEKNGVFRTNMEVMVFAAAVGLHCDNRQPVESKTHEISTLTFERGVKEEYSYLFMIPLISMGNTPDFNTLRDSIGEEKCIRIFQEYAAGGLQILSDHWKKAGLKRPATFISDVVREFMSPSSSIKTVDGGGRVASTANDPDDIF
jgi:dnd system-associated protein 4